MKIKRIDICGFKSFCDKTGIAFPDPITAIVGPNGCGKSNIVDAIRWVMGEQSAKHLRGRAMEDVIFAGSETRGPMGMAEVSLTFDGGSLMSDVAPGGVPWGAVAPTEIVVTRRLYRSGESEYLLNGVPCRLRDIVEFFLGTGVGSKAYSIIEQGRIGFIVSSRAEDRRGLIDEAAGITKYKVKKKAAERRMDSTRQHLVRVSDIIGEIEGRLRSLRLQAQKAERYKRYKAELKDLEIWAASQRFLGYLAEQKALTGELAELREKHVSQAAALEVSEAAVETDRLAVTEDMNELNALKDELFGISNKAQLGLQRAQHHESEAEHLRSQAQAGAREIEDLNVRRESHGAALAELEGQIDRLEADASLARDAFLEREREHEARRTELNEARALLERDASVVSGGRARIARAEAEKSAAIQRKEDLLQRLEALVAEEETAAARATELGREAEELRTSVAALRGQLSEAKEARQDIEQEIAEAKRTLVAREKELDARREEHHRRRSRLASLGEIQARYESFQKGVRAVMRGQHDGLAGVRGLVADVLQSEPGLEAAVEAVLGERLGHVVVEGTDVALAAVAFLKQGAEGRATFLPLAPRQGSSGAPPPEGAGVQGLLLDRLVVDTAYRPLADHLFAGVVLVDDLEVARALWAAHPEGSWTFVTREGDVFTAAGGMSGGSRESLGGILEQKREIRELESVVERLERETQEGAAAVAAAKQHIEERSLALEETGRVLRQAEVELITQQKDLDRSSDELNRLTGRKRQLDHQRADLTRALEDTEERLETAGETLARDGGDVEAAEARVDSLRERTHALADEVDELVRGLSELKVAAAQTHDRRENARNTVTRLRAELGDFELRVTRLTTTIAEQSTRAKSLSADAATLREESALLQGEAEERARVHGERQGELEERMSMLAGREAELRQLRAEVGRLNQTITRLDMRLQEVTMKKAGLEEQMGARYPDVFLPNVVYDHHLRPPVGEVEEARTKELRGLLDRMGEINLTAIEEAEELQKRFDFLSGQKADLENAIGQLEAAIEKINKASLRRFRETFEAVNARFQEVFPRLFGGGRAHLALTDEADLLETGVDILANPPGKKVSQNIELMSGGEKALTAVSLLFAIFLVKPSPFCVLDEVDAPLDEANVGRFNDVVREMTDRSQFIIISHNRRTMEIADRLCGITMEEPGVSKLVSVALRNGDAERMAQAKVLTRQEEASGNDERAQF